MNIHTIADAFDVLSTHAERLDYFNRHKTGIVTALATLLGPKGSKKNLISRFREVGYVLDPNLADTIMDAIREHLRRVTGTNKPQKLPRNAVSLPTIR